VNLTITTIGDRDVPEVIALWEHRFKGFGRDIMRAAEDWLRPRGIQKLQLMVRPDNAKVHAFYEALGYFEQKRVTYAKWLDGREPTP